MKAQLIILFTLALIFNSKNAIAQVQALASNPIAATEGSPYLDDKFSTGEIVQNTKKQKYQLRYNAYRDVMEYTQNGQSFQFDPSPEIKKAQLNNAVYVVDKFTYKGATKYGFLNQLDSGKMTLYLKSAITFTDAKRAGNLDGTDSPPRFTRSDLFYYKIGGGQPAQIENLKKFIGSLPDKQEEMTTYAKKEKLSVKKQNELIKLVKYYNSL